MKKINFLFAILCLAVMSCNPNDDSDSNANAVNDFAKNFGAVASRDFIGQVVDVNNLPIQNVTVKIGTSTVQTDVNGVFIINNADVYVKFAYITAKKAGYIDGSRAMIPTVGKNNVKIMMIPSTPIATIQSGISSEVALPSGTKVVFDGAFETEAGVAYTGSVAVSLFHLKSSDENMGSLMPGMLYAQAADGSPKVLETFGMMEVELHGSGGEKVQIAKTHTAQVKMQIDAAQLATAPSSIPLWHFDEINGYWKEEGSATKVGNQYVGTVSHFSWWNCDIPNSSILLTFNIIDATGNPIPNVLIDVSSLSGSHSSGNTDNNGQLNGLVPENQILTLKIYSQTQCLTLPIYSINIGPYSVDTVLPDIVINSSNVISTTIEGSLKKCDNTNVTNGYILLSYSGESLIVPITNGTFSINTIYCNSATSFTLKGVDYDNQTTTNTINYNYATPITNVGILNACYDMSEYIYFRINNGPTVFFFENLFAGITPTGGFRVTGQKTNDSNDGIIVITGYSSIPGTGSEIDIFGNQDIAYGSNNNTLFYDLSQIGAIGEYIDLTFDCSYTNYVGTKRIVGFAHIKRVN